MQRSPASTVLPSAALQSARQDMADLLGYRWKWSAIVTAAHLRLADILADGPRSIAELAARSHTNESSLYLLLQFLAYSGIFAEVSPRRFAQTERSEALRSDVPGSLFPLVMMQGSSWHTAAWACLDDSISTGESAFRHAHGQAIWEYFLEHPQDKQVFDQTMGHLSNIFDPAILAAYDFAWAHACVDVGGGNGTFAGALARAYPELTVTVFDLPSAVATADAYFARQGLQERCRTVAGSFLEHVPSGADVYVLKQILHDWDDDHALQILRVCRDAMSAGSALLIMEMIPQPQRGTPPPGGYPPFMGFLPLQMLVLFGGRERTEEDFTELLARADLRLKRTLPTRSAYVILECERA